MVRAVGPGGSPVTLKCRPCPPRPRRVPAWLARFFVGEEIVRLISHSMPTTNARFRDAFDWSPRYPTYRDGLDQVLETWRESGTIREHAGGFAWVGD